jgi:hypothetical protein
VWLEVECNRCKTRASLPFDAIRRPRDTPIWKLEAALKCRSCKKGRYAPPEDESISQEHMAQLVKHYVRGAYFRFCARTGFKPFSRATLLPQPPGHLQSTANAS